MSPMKWKPMCLGGVLLMCAGALAQCLPTYKLRSDKEVEGRRPGRLFSAIKMPSCESEIIGTNEAPIAYLNLHRSKVLRVTIAKYNLELLGQTSIQI